MLPKVEYALPVWYAPIQPSTSGGRATGAVGHTCELEKVQRLACKLITGTFRMTASDILEVHAHVPPVALRLANTCHREALRICALPASHPLSRPALRASRSTPRYHCSPLHMLLHGFNLRPNSIKTVNPAPKHPNWTPLLTMHIAADKDKAAVRTHTRMDEVQVFCDGSGLKGGIGAAAVVMTPPEGPHLQYLLGKDMVHTVFESELVGILLALQLLRRYPSARTALIALDNQAAFAALTNRPSQPGQYLVNTIHDQLHALRHSQPRMRVHVEWTPGHAKIGGNERADMLTCATAEGARSPLNDLPRILRRHLPTSIAALKANRRQKLVPTWAEKWKASPRHMKMSHINPTLRSHKAYQTIFDRPCQDASILMQL